MFGDLEQAVMDVLWARTAPTPVRDVHDELAQRREIAYTTVMTVLDRLAKKGIVLRRLGANAQYVYQKIKQNFVFAHHGAGFFFAVRGKGKVFFFI